MGEWFCESGRNAMHRVPTRFINLRGTKFGMLHCPLSIINYQLSIVH